MQDRYSGDVGDFGKFGLLRHLVYDTPYRLGINWYLYPNESHNDDGRFIKYLSSQQFRECDQELHKKLASVVKNTRSTKALESAQLFRAETNYYSGVVCSYAKFPGQAQANKSKRLHLRVEWQKEAIYALPDSNVLFLDPDNGLEIGSCSSINQKRSGKFAYYEEIIRFH